MRLILNHYEKMQESSPSSTKPQNHMMVPRSGHKRVLTVVLPLSETTDFLTDQLRTLISLLRALRALPTNVKLGSADEMRKLYLEQLVAKKLADASVLNDVGKNWKEQKEKYDKIASLEDLRKLDWRS